MNKTEIIFAIREPKPLRGFPEGRVRLRLRNDEFARAFVRTPEGIRHFIVQETPDGFWEPVPGCEQGRNVSI